MPDAYSASLNQIPSAESESSMSSMITNHLVIDCQHQQNTIKDDSLAAAMLRKDRDAIHSLTGICDQKTRAPIPERAEKYIDKLKKSPPLKETEINQILTLFWQYVGDKIWWMKKSVTAKDATTPLRAVAEVIHGSLDSWHITGDKKYLEMAISSGDYLLQVQQEIASGGFGFPAWKDNSSNLGRIASRFLLEAEKKGLTSQVLNNGWIIDDLGRGDLYFDNGLAGEALISLYRETKNSQYLESAKSAAKWAASKPVVSNFNYNSFSVILLSEVYAETGDLFFLNEAISRAGLGVFSGMIRQGEDAGHWIDPHNERVVYRQVMIRAITSLIARTPDNHPKRSELLSNFNLMTEAMFKQQLTFGISNPDSTMLSYCETLKHTGDASISAWPPELASTLSNIATTSLLKKKPFGGPAAVGCFLKNL